MLGRSTAPTVGVLIHRCEPSGHRFQTKLLHGRRPSHAVYDVKRISFCPSRYWPYGSRGPASSRRVEGAARRRGALRRLTLSTQATGLWASLVRTEYGAAGWQHRGSSCRARRARTAAWYRRTGTAAPVLLPQSEHRRPSICSSLQLPSGSRLGLSGSTAWRLQGVKGGWRPPCSGCVGPTASSSGAQRQWRSIGARSMLDARSFMISTLRSQVSFAAAIGPLRKPASASHVLSSSRHRGLQKSRCTAARRPLRVCCARIHFANRLRAGAGRRSRSGRRPGRVRWGRPLQGSGSTSESAAGSGRLRACGCSCGC